MTEFENYIRRMEEIRRLSTPALDDISNADGYSQLLHDNFEKIGALAAENREFLDKILYPMISADSIDDARLSELFAFSDELICAENAENLDLQMVSVVSDRLVTDAMEHDDLYEQIRSKDLQIGIYYELMNMTKRIHAYPEIADHYRQKGLQLGDYFYDLLKKENFEKIEDVECRHIVITNARYSIANFEGIENDPEANAKQLERLQLMYDICNDPFYIAMLPDYDWTYHLFRTLQYYMMAAENNNAAGFTDDQLDILYKRGLEQHKLWEEKREYLSEILGSEEDVYSIELMLKRIEYLRDKISLEDYQKCLMELYSHRDMNSYASGKMYTSLIIPVEYITVINKNNIPEQTKDQLYDIYRDILKYSFGMPNSNTLTVMLEYLYDIIHNFIEIPSCITFEDMVLQCMAAIHPPTYVHSLMVGQITECLCGHMLRLMPERLIGVCGYDSLEEVLSHRDEILSFAYHSALCHDFGKISIIDTVFIYGRKLLDSEFDLIKTHPKTGYEMMSRFASTKKYAHVALGHHKWYDNSRGYPEEFDTSSSKDKPIIDVVLCADCLDAATDTIGRSYNRGKTLSDYVKELEEGSGTRYAPWLCELFKDKDVMDNIEHLLTVGRNRNYRNTYYLLRDMHDRSHIHE